MPNVATGIAEQGPVRTEAGLPLLLALPLLDWSFSQPLTPRRRQNTDSAPRGGPIISEAERSGTIPGRPRTIPRRLIVWLLWLYLAVLALIAFWPTPVDKPVSKQLNTSINQAHHDGAPRWFTYSFVEASANVALFIPFGVLVALLLPPKRWWLAIPAGFLTSCCIELGQLLFLSARFATVQDVVVNTAGTVIGAVGVFAIRLLLSRRRLA